MSTRPVPVPETCGASYAVMTPEPLDVEDHLVLPPDALLRRYGTSPTAITRLRGCPHQRIVRCRTTPARAATELQRTRVRCLDLAAARDGVVLELLPPRVLELTSDQVSAEHAGQWYVLDYDRLSEGIVGTDGLEQFGLPEVTVEGVDPAVHAMTDAVIAGLAHRLIAEWPRHDPVGPATVTLRDIAYGLGAVEASVTSTARSIDLEIGYRESDHRLDVRLRQDPTQVLFS